jgi:hypothetical protein
MSMSICKFDLSILELLLAAPFLACYDGDDDSGGDGGDDDSGAGDTGSQDGSGGSSKTFTQDEVNKFLADDRRKHAKKMEALQSKLETTLKSSQLTQEERDSLETSLEDVRKQLMTKEQIAAQEKKKLASEYETKLTEAQERAKQFEQRYNQSTIQRALQDAAIANEAFNPSQVVALLSSKTKLVDDKPVVDFEDRHVETGDAITTQLSPADTVKRMRELPEIYGNLFKANVAPGVGQNNGSHQGGKIDKSRLSPAEYRKLRQENPEALGLRGR